MKIEINKVSVKLTKSLCNQMKEATLDVLRNGTILGTLVKVVKDQGESILFSHNGSFFVISTAWERSSPDSSYVWMKRGKWSVTMNFSNTQKAQEWYSAYKACLDTIKENNIQQIFV